MMSRSAASLVTAMVAALLLMACSARPAHIPLLGSDRDPHGCIPSAGYQWSPLRQQCLRLFEAALRLSPIAPQHTDVAFVLFETNGPRAELSLGDGQQIALMRDTTAPHPQWQGGDYRLVANEGYHLYVKGQLRYQGQPTDEQAVEPVNAQYR